MVVAPTADNQSILITGRSGSGKTYALQKIERNIVSEGGAVVVLNYRGSHDEWTDSEENVSVIRVAEEGLPLTIMYPLTRSDGTRESAVDVGIALVGIFDTAVKLSQKQKAVLRKAILMAFKEFAIGVDEVALIVRMLKEIGGDEAEAVYEKFFSVFSKLRICPRKDTVFQKGKIVILDLQGFDAFGQKCVAELILAIFWRYFQSAGKDAKTTLFLVCDEFQHLSLRKDSALSQILREGRKFHLALLLATQTLEGLEPDQCAVVQQAATMLYFRPAAKEIPKILRMMGKERGDRMEGILQELTKGSCVAVGRFQIGFSVLERPIKIQF